MKSVVPADEILVVHVAGVEPRGGGIGFARRRYPDAHRPEEGVEGDIDAEGAKWASILARSSGMILVRE